MLIERQGNSSDLSELGEQLVARGLAARIEGGNYMFLPRTDVSAEERAEINGQYNHLRHAFNRGIEQDDRERAKDSIAFASSGPYRSS